MATTKQSAGRETGGESWTAEEKAAMKERARELKAAGKKADYEKDLLAKIAEMDEQDRVMAERIHALVGEHAPSLFPKTGYVMPAYVNADGKTIVFFQAASKFQARFATLGFNDSALLDAGNMWETAFGLVAIGPAEEQRITALLKKAVGPTP